MCTISFIFVILLTDYVKTKENVMGNLIRRKDLTDAQYKRANMVMSVILVLSYVTYFIVELLNVSKHGFGLGVTLRCGLYIV